MKKNKNNRKRISYIDEERQTLVECEFAMRRDITSVDIDDFCKSIYGMKLDSSLYPEPVLENKVTAYDVVEEFKKLLDPSTYIVDFKGVDSLFRSEKSNQQNLIKYPLQRFLGFFHLEKKSEFPMETIAVMDTFSRHPNFMGNEKAMIQTEISSLNVNTKILNQQFPKRSLQQRKRNIHKVKEKIK